MRTHEGTTKEGKEKGAVTPLNQRPDGAATRSDRNCDVDERSYGVEGVIVARHGIGDESEDLAFSEKSKWHGIVSWTWDAQDETCGICRMAFDGCCPDCKLPGDDCPLIWGVCNHAFHLHCILKWVNSQTSQAHCPMCRREWQFKG
ncbi:anaphase-promoting complex subunit 11-like isoform X3 [Vigna unguiculata]|uniref:anaphase-promoting complex subunit 11-like isoform X3 n=1 Tax=Vigna unguiculata TaxID=3917 RepID=UPI0010162D8D|nr:anaphase-promoting complex subunit 11-like isoform X3 [Vigna unguiculata]